MSWRQVELRKDRLTGAGFAIACWLGVPIVWLIGGEAIALSPFLIIAGALPACVLVFDLTLSKGQRENFIEDAELRGSTEYAERLKARKF